MGRRNPFMPPEPRNRVCPIRVAALRLAVERRYLGITNVLLQHETKRESHHVGTVLARLTREGKLVGASVVGHPRHWFITQDVADMWATSTAPLPKAAPTQRQKILLRRRPGLPAPATLGERADGADVPAQIPPGVQVQRCPSVAFDPRYQVDPASHPFGAGFAAAGIGRDVTTGRTWSQP